MLYYTAYSEAKHQQHCFAGTYIDKKCPFTGNISIRGRILSGIVKSTKMNKTIIVRRNYVHYIKKYARYVLHLVITAALPCAALVCTSTTWTLDYACLVP